MENGEFDLLGSIMHFAFGAFVGFVLSGAVVWWFADFFPSSAWWVVGITSLVVALLGGFFGDKFWKVLGENPLFRLWAKYFS